ncbi:hypothetical protein SAMN05421787_104168 [Virgibacillus pantothenticus]|nr:hypothetical protein SAMN05421787_104168 [Virgibacillus pantothenticus]
MALSSGIQFYNGLSRKLDAVRRRAGSSVLQQVFGR